MQLDSNTEYWSFIGGASACVVGLALVAMTVQHRDAEAIRQQARGLGLGVPRCDWGLIGGAGCLTLLTIPLLLGAAALGGFAMTLCVATVLALAVAGSGLLAFEKTRAIGATVLVFAVLAAAVSCGSDLEWTPGTVIEGWLSSRGPLLALFCLTGGLFGTLLMARMTQTGFLLKPRVTPTLRRHFTRALFEMEALCRAYKLQLAATKAAAEETPRLAVFADAFFKEKQIDKELVKVEKNYRKACDSERLAIRDLLHYQRNLVELRREVEDQIRQLRSLAEQTAAAAHPLIA